MLSNQKLYTFSRRLEWTLLLILFAGAIYFQYETWTMYLRQDSSFKIKEENIEEGPTLTFCPRAGYEILQLMVANRLEHVINNSHHFNSGMNFLSEGQNTINWKNQNITINQYTIETLWGTCVMLEFDFEDITKFVRDWIVIYMCFVEDSEPDFWSCWTDDIENQDINQNETRDINPNKTERISQDWLGYDVYVTSKVEFV